MYSNEQRPDKTMDSYGWNLKILPWSWLSLKFAKSTKTLNGFVKHLSKGSQQEKGHYKAILNHLKRAGRSGSLNRLDDDDFFRVFWQIFWRKRDHYEWISQWWIPRNRDAAFDRC